MELTLQDIKSVLLALIATLLFYGIRRFWQYRTKKAMNKRISELQEEQEWLERVGTSFEEAVLFSFRLLFAILFLFGLASLVRPFFIFISGSGSGLELIQFSSWVVVVVAAAVAVSKLGQIRRYPDEKEQIKAKIETLQERLSKFQD